MSHPEHGPEKQMARMNPEVKARWVAALRSGEYKQGKGMLRDGNAFCCLGVLCNLHAQEHPHIAASQDDPDSYLGESALLPEPVVAWAGLNNRGRTEVRIDRHYTILPSHNDNGRTFAEIADAIESQL